MKLINILKEIRVMHAGNLKRLSPQDLKDIDLVFNTFGDGHSGFNLYKPITEIRTKYSFGGDNGPDGEFELYHEEENYPEYQAFKRLIEKPRGIYVDKKSDIPPCPGAFTISFNIRLEVDPVNININPNYGPSLLLSTPDYSMDGRYSVGWFDGSSKYHADTAHFDEDGEYIG